MALGKLFSGMFTNASQQPTTNANPAGELEHINREMYAKNLELAERNKTLSLLRQIDEIILGSVTNPNEIATQVTHLLVSEGGFKVVSISIVDSQAKTLNRIGLTESKVLETSRTQVVPQGAQITVISMTMLQNILVQAVNERTVKATTRIADINLYQLSLEQLQKIQEYSGIKCFLVYPLIVREYAIGTMMVCI